MYDMRLAIRSESLLVTEIMERSDLFWKWHEQHRSGSRHVIPSPSTKPYRTNHQNNHQRIQIRGTPKGGSSSREWYNCHRHHGPHGSRYIIIVIVTNITNNNGHIHDTASVSHAPTVDRRVIVRIALDWSLLYVARRLVRRDRHITTVGSRVVSQISFTVRQGGHDWEFHDVLQWFPPTHGGIGRWTFDTKFVFAWECQFSFNTTNGGTLETSLSLISHICMYLHISTFANVFILYACTCGNGKILEWNV